MILRIATRKSPLALAQTRWVAARIRDKHPTVTVEEVHVVTEGDRILDRPLAEIGGKGLFVSEVEATLASGRADIAVHSMKDVPGDLMDGLAIVCIPEREDPRDVLVSRDGAELDALPAGVRIGTSSLRRMAQLRALRPDLAYVSVRGNVDTRLRKMEEGQFTAVVLAMAGLRRLDLHHRPLHILDAEASIPAIGQGALAIEARKDDEQTMKLIAHLEHPETRVAVEAERAFLRKLQGNCKSPIAGYARFTEGGSRLVMDGLVASVDGDRILTGSATCAIVGRNVAARIEAAKDVALEVAENLIKDGADELIRQASTATVGKHLN